MTEPRNQEFFTEPELQPKRRWWRRFRRADSGQFTTAAHDAANPDTTVAEKVERKPEPPPWTGVR